MTLSAQAVAALARNTAGVRIEVVERTGSTNADLLARAPALAGPLLLAALEQTAGRGRAGRSWLSAPDASLTFSLAWPFEGGPGRLAGLPLAVGVALAETLRALDVGVQLKWPNDLLKDGSKLAGILVETQTVDGVTWAVIGVGLNLDLPDALEAQIGRPAASATWLARMDRNELLARLLDSLAAMAAEFAQHGFGAFCGRWNRAHAWHGFPVVILDRGEVVHQGVAMGVDESGQLQLDTASGRIAVMSGDVSLRLKE
ncbi:biotin--[acetyl-CoA-carboxylase] ligase [Pseudoduganella sp. GCM10020061]|uniref:biotin--[acetyl-CoA-carboxylase] ligase n=1 Tax=Pseudoduganella sp. GCM10020061 TaxID=3317345 RepID=UPI00363B768A